MKGDKRFENLRRATVWLVLAALVIYRALHMPPAISERARAVFGGHRALWISGLLWILVSLYWEVQARNSAVDNTAESGVSRALHVFLVNAALLLLFAPVSGLSGRYLPGWTSIAGAGLIIEACSLFLAVWSRRVLGRNWSGRITIKQEHQLIRTGPYRFVRHPIYTAFLGMYAGTALVSGEWHALIGLLLAVAAYWRKIKMEEGHLAAYFGDQWEGYSRSTGFLLPTSLRSAR